MNKLLSALLCLVLVGCTLNSGDWREVRVRIQTPATAGHLLTSRLPIARGGFADDPSSIDDMQCVGLNIVGKGIRSYDPDEMAVDFDALVAGEDCTYPGVGTGLKTMGQQEFEMKVSAGNNRIFQVYGIESSSSDCADLPPMGDLMLRARKGTLPSRIQGIYEVGRTVLSEFRTDTTVEIGNSYDSADSKNFLACTGGGGGGLTVVTDKFGLGPSEARTFLVTGGSGSYSCSASPALGTCAVTGGTVTFTAPSAGSLASAFTDVVLTFTDTSTSDTGTASGVVFSPAAFTAGDQPQLWLSASDALGSFSWGNKLTGKDLSGLSTAPTGFSQNLSGGPKSTAIYESPGGSLPAMFATSVPVTFSSSWDGATAYLVVRATAGTSLLCVSPRSMPALDCGSYSEGVFTIRRAGNSYTLQVSNGSSGDTVINTNGTTSFQIHEVIWDRDISAATASLGYMLGNSRQVTNGLTAATAPLLVNAMGTHLSIGGPTIAADMEGAISEVLIFGRAVSLADRRSILRYLNYRYGLAVLNP